MRLVKQTSLTAAALVLGLGIALSGCATGPAANGDSTEPPTPTAGVDEPTTDGETEESPPLDHSAALAAGISGETAIVCRYTYDEEEFELLKMLAMGGEVNPEATVYLSGSTVYWDILEPGDKLAHILTHEGSIYTWKIPDDGLAAKATLEDPDAELGRLMAQIKKNTSDCEVYTGPASIFSVPNDLTFEFFPG